MFRRQNLLDALTFHGPVMDPLGFCETYLVDQTHPTARPNKDEYGRHPTLRGRHGNKLVEVLDSNDGEKKMTGYTARRRQLCVPLEKSMRPERFCFPCYYRPASQRCFKYNALFRSRQAKSRRSLCHWTNFIVRNRAVDYCDRMVREIQRRSSRVVGIGRGFVIFTILQAIRQCPCDTRVS